MKLLLAVAIFILIAPHAVGQTTHISKKEWIKKLSIPEDLKSECYQLFYHSVVCKMDVTPD